MRYSVFDSSGKWQASYNHKIPNVPLKNIKSWAKQTGKLVGGKVYERIVPSDKKYKPREHLIYDFTHLPNKLEGVSKRNNKDSYKGNNKKKNKKDKE